LEANKLDSHPVAVFVFKYRSRRQYHRMQAVELLLILSYLQRLSSASWLSRGP